MLKPYVFAGSDEIKQDVPKWNPPCFALALQEQGRQEVAKPAAEEQVHTASQLRI